jgi:hypothetical protein
VTVLGDQQRYRVVAGRIEHRVWHWAGAENGENFSKCFPVTHVLLARLEAQGFPG